MNETEHVFPLPELELHKLEEVKEEIVHPFSRRPRRFLGANVRTMIALSVIAGFACGLACGRRG